MICLEVRLNGRRVCRVGVPEPGLAHASTGWVFREPKAGSRPKKSRPTLNIGGMTLRGDEPREHFAWPQRKLSVEDEVSLKWTECRRPDKPPETKPWPSPEKSLDNWLAALVKDCDWIATAKGRRASALLSDLRDLLQKHQRRRRGPSIPRSR
jgi:hypothetical protein